MHVRLKSTPGIYLVGFMGCGKTTVGRKLAERLAWDFIDLDDEIERRAGSSISEVFAGFGERAFRAIERDALREQAHLVRSGRARVVALGGGTFADESNRDTIRQAGLSLWLDVSLEELWTRVSDADHRPLARDRQAFEALYKKRLEDYANADFTIAAGALGSYRIVEDVLALSLF